MINKNKCKKMWVIDNVRGVNITAEAIIIDVLDDGSCIAVKNEDETYFYENKYYRTCRHDSCEEIKESGNLLMISKEYTELVKKINNKFDEPWQITQEECAELIVECSKVIREKARPEKLLEEMSDVLLCLTRILLTLGKDYEDLVNISFDKMIERFPEMLEK